MITNLDHVFVETIPDILDEGILYVSLRFRVIMHSCCCGCKKKVVTPLSPVRWRMTFDGKTISLYPSIGNWNFDCQSHYWIENSKVKWAGKWTEDEITSAKNYERKKRSHYYDNINKTDSQHNRKERGVQKQNHPTDLRLLLKSMINFFKNK